ncbi:MAG: ATP-binding protein [Acidimicrobiia bacterium]|nr:ATP-binding protein [Acidimicrobiia bacterium]
MLSIDALMAAKEAAEEESQRKSELLSHASHEIRTQLSGIIGMAQVVQDTKLDPEQREFVDLIAQSGDALLTLVNDLLDASKIEADRLVVEAVPFNLCDTVEDTVATFRTGSAEKGLDLHLVVEPSVPELVIGDPGRFRQVLANLISNAKKFTDAGSITVEVEASRQPSGGPWLIEVAVTDTGIGIPKEDQGRIFDAFVQSEDWTSRARGGTGLGLSIAQKLVKLMGGSMMMESEEGRGSTFRFTVQLAEQGNTDQVRPVGRSVLAGLPVLLVGQVPDGLRVQLENSDLVVDTIGDQRSAILRLLAAQAADAPYAVTVVFDPTEAMGFAKSVRIRPELDSVHVVVVTVSGQRGDAAECRQLNIGGYLTLPHAIEDVAVAIREVLTGPSPHDLTTLVTRHWLRERRRRLSILVADDSPANRMTARKLLERRGHIVRTAVDGPGVASAVETHRFDVVLMDTDMPGMDAAGTLRAIRSAHGPLEVPVIAMVATESERLEAESNVVPGGYNAVLVKPIDIPQLIGSIEASLATPVLAD